MLREKRFVFDVEVFPNLFLLSVRGRLGDKVVNKNFFIEDREEAQRWFLEKGLWQISFNGMGYDDIVVAFWLCNPNATLDDIYDMNQYLIHAHVGNYIVDDFIMDNYNVKDIIRKGLKRKNHYLKYNSDAFYVLGGATRCSIDLFKISQDSGSLKQAGIILKHDSLVETSIPFGTVLDEAGKIETVAYCQHDLDLTELVYDYYEQNLTVRDEFYINHNIKRAHNVGSAKLAELYLESMYAEEYGKEKLKDLRDYHADEYETLERASIPQIMEDYSTIEFKDERLKFFYNNLKHMEVLFKYSDRAETAYYKDDLTRPLKIPHKADESISLKGLTTFTLDDIRVHKDLMQITDKRGCVYQFGVGGLHDNNTNLLITCDNTNMTLVNVDVTSYYPSLIKVNNLNPVCFPSFSLYVSRLLTDRIKIKADPTKKTESNAKKLVLNSSFGKTKERFSILYDQLVHHKITISGQVLLLKLIDMVYEVSPDIRVVNANTDGVCFHCPKDCLEQLRVKCNEWEVLSKVNLEEEIYDRWIQSSCNNYAALRSDGVVKTKGATFQLGVDVITKAMTIPEAVKKCIVNYTIFDKPIDETLSECVVSDFMISGKFSGDKTKLVYKGELSGKKMIRYYVSNSGEPMYAHRASTGINSIVCGGNNLKLADVLSEVDIKDVDYNYYAREAKIKIMYMNLVKKKKDGKLSKDLPAPTLRTIETDFEKFEMGINPIEKKVKAPPKKPRKLSVPKKPKVPKKLKKKSIKKMPIHIEPEERKIANRNGGHCKINPF